MSKNISILIETIIFVVAFSITASLFIAPAKADSPPAAAIINVSQNKFASNYPPGYDVDTSKVTDRAAFAKCLEISNRILARNGASWASESRNEIFDSTCESILRGDPQN